MKTRGHILSSLLLVGAMTTFQVSVAQEEGFNMPNSERESESNISHTTSGERHGTIYTTTDPVKKSTEKKTEKPEEKKTSSNKVAEDKPEDQKTRTVTKPEKPATSNPDNSPKNNQEESDESVLSFNFLYYMIQKFKFSDVIDQ